MSENIPPDFQPFPSVSPADVPKDQQLFHFSQDSAKLLKFFEQRAKDEEEAMERFVLHGGSPMVVKVEPMPPSLLLQPPLPPPRSFSPSPSFSPLASFPPRRSSSFSESMGRGRRRGYSPQSSPRSDGQLRARHGSFNGEQLNYMRSHPPPSVSFLPAQIPMPGTPFRAERPTYPEHSTIEATILHVLRVARTRSHSDLFKETMAAVDQREKVDEKLFKQCVSRLATLQNLWAERDQNNDLIYHYRD